MPDQPAKKNYQSRVITENSGIGACTRCGCLVSSKDLALHNHWHDKVAVEWSDE